MEKVESLHFFIGTSDQILQKFALELAIHLAQVKCLSENDYIGIIHCKADFSDYISDTQIVNSTFTLKKIKLKSIENSKTAILFIEDLIKRNSECKAIILDCFHLIIGPMELELRHQTLDIMIHYLLTNIKDESASFKVYFFFNPIYQAVVPVAFEIQKLYCLLARIKQLPVTHISKPQLYLAERLQFSPQEGKRQSITVSYQSSFNPLVMFVIDILNKPQRVPENLNDIPEPNPFI